jgi:hypothetical protein
MAYQSLIKPTQFLKIMCVPIINEMGFPSVELLLAQPAIINVAIMAVSV